MESFEHQQLVAEIQDGGHYVSELVELLVAPPIATKRFRESCTMEAALTLIDSGVTSDLAEAREVVADLVARRIAEIEEQERGD